MSTPSKKKPAGLSWITMALLTTTAVASVRGLPAMAPYGLASIFLYVLP
ncbi:MAG: amino acid:proton antiporter, partial [Actinobacteria bacterium]|nr:amino acid:proton antiporter [Actinomycetota bacterium]